MRRSSVGRLRLRITAESGSQERARCLAEQFARTVLDECCQRLEARFAGRLLLIRRLAPTWFVSEEKMNNPAEAMRSAANLAEQIKPVNSKSMTSPGTPDLAVLFDDESDWLASFLKSSEGPFQSAWYFDHWRNDGLAQRLAAPAGREILVQALLRLDADQALPGVLANLDRTTTDLLANVLGLRLPPESLERPSDRGPSLSPSFLSDGSERGDDGSDRSLTPTLSSVAAAIARHIKALSQLQSSANREPPVPSPDAEMDRAAAPLDCDSGQIQPRSAALDRDSWETKAGLTAQPELSEQMTHYAGLFYLLAPAMELGIGEMLWKACLPEGAILARSMAVLLGPAAGGDVASSLFCGVTDDLHGELPFVSTEQQAEVCGQLLEATIAALPRRGLASLPQVDLELVAAAGGKILVALCYRALIFFAWPASDVRSASAGLEVFLKAWPASAPRPRAPRALASFDLSGRLLPAEVELRPQSLILPPAPRPAATALLAQIIGSLLSLFVSRLRAGTEGEPFDLASTTARYISIPGRIILAPERLTVQMPMDQIDLCLRRSALDGDPGWIPWLRRTVVFEFVREAGGDE